MGYLKEKIILMIFEYHEYLKYKYVKRESLSRCYYVSMFGLNKETIEWYLRDQENADRISDAMSVGRRKLL